MIVAIAPLPTVVDTVGKHNAAIPVGLALFPSSFISVPRAVVAHAPPLWLAGLVHEAFVAVLVIGHLCPGQAKIGVAPDVVAKGVPLFLLLLELNLGQLKLPFELSNHLVGWPVWGGRP